MRLLPPYFSDTFYRETYPDLSMLSEKELKAHFIAFGIKEGRVGSPIAWRRGLIDLVEFDDTVLEIGPFNNPQLVGPKVSYLDVMDEISLTARAIQLGLSTASLPKIDFVATSQYTKVVGDRRFDVVFSSHCIEHQPDLCTHLSEVCAILNPGGYYLLVVPDKRYCFDHFLPETSIADIVEAHHFCLTRHTLRSVIEHRTLITHNDAQRHWKGDHGISLFNEQPESVIAALNEFIISGNNYLDVHAWKFTPATFETIIVALNTINLTKLTPIRVMPTPLYSNEFCVVLKKID